ncbi:MAG: ETC complex I subunit, partial [Alphaproteobacteria bacterium]
PALGAGSRWFESGRPDHGLPRSPGREGGDMWVRIFRPAKTAMQSGRAKTKQWIVEFEPLARKGADPLMGWIGSRDTRGQVRLAFDSREAAVAYATQQGFEFQVDEPRERQVRPKSYADNFRPGQPF